MLVALLVGLAGPGCAPYSARLADLRPQLAEGDYDAALAVLEKTKGGKEMLLYWLEQGLVLHYADRWQESNEAFAQAEILAADLYTKSISEGALSLVTSDESISYRGPPYEMAMVPYYRAMNYVYLGQREAALVEARKASQLMARYVDATLGGVEDEADQQALERLKNDAFLLYFSGMLYDWDGEINDAFIAYRNAALAYQRNAGLLDLDVPPALARDLERTGARLGFQDELDALRRAAPLVFGGGAEAGPEDVGEGGSARAATPPAGRGDAGATASEDSLAFGSATRDAPVRWRAGTGEVVLLLEVGYVPRKTQVRVDIPIFKNANYDDPHAWAGRIAVGMGNMQAFVGKREVAYWLTIALPRLEPEPPVIAGARISVGDVATHAVTHRAQNVAEVARVTFDAEYGSVLLKTILRGLTKYLATNRAEKSNEWLGLAANVFGSVTERADTRSWLTLPATIELGRLTLPAGVHDLEVELVDARGRTVERRTIAGVTVRSGDWTFMNRRVF